MLGPIGSEGGPSRGFAAAPSAKTAAASPEQKKLRKACEEFESVMLGIVFKQMSASAKGGMLDQSAANKTWRDMLEDERAKSMAQAGGIGLADSLYRELEQRL